LAVSSAVAAELIRWTIHMGEGPRGFSTIKAQVIFSLKFVSWSTGIEKAYRPRKIDLTL
jgi:hypothetical protein